jgi:bloom syndrome protein
MLVALVVDEAHCVKTWGDEFCVAFAHIGELRSLIPSTTSVMALAATATQDTYEAVVQSLKMKNVVIHQGGPILFNHFYHWLI